MRVPEGMTHWLIFIQALEQKRDADSSQGKESRCSFFKNERNKGVCPFLRHAGAKGSQLIIIKGMNHILKEVAGDLPAQMPSYFDPELELQKDLANEIVTFIESAS